MNQTEQLTRNQYMQINKPAHPTSSHPHQCHLTESSLHSSVPTVAGNTNTQAPCIYPHCVLTDRAMKSLCLAEEAITQTLVYNKIKGWAVLFKWTVM